MRGGTLQQLWICGASWGYKEDLSDNSFSNFHNIVSLKKLSISQCRVLGPSGFNSICWLRRLAWLRLNEACNLQPEDIVTAMEQSELHCLTYLDLSHCYPLDDVGLLAVARACPSLTSVRLGRNATNDNQLLFVHSLNRCYNVTCVGLGHLGHHCCNLVSLRLGMRTIEDDFLALPTLVPKLKSLEVVPDTGDVEELRRKNPSLVVMEWCGDRAGLELADSAEYFCDMITKSPTLGI